MAGGPSKHWKQEIMMSWLVLGSQLPCPRMAGSLRLSLASLSLVATDLVATGSPLCPAGVSPTVGLHASVASAAAL